MKRKTVVIITPYYLFPSEGANRRFRYICEKLSMQKINVHLVTSDFLHLKKKHRVTSSSMFKDLGYKVSFVYEPGYKKNISLKRVKSQRKYAENLKQFLETLTDVDLVYCAIPTPEAAVVAGEYSTKKKIPFLLDVQDLWPEAMKMIIDIPLISNILFKKMELETNKAYSLADSLVAVSETYLNRAKSVNYRSKKDLVVYIGTDMDKFDYESEASMNRVEKDSKEIWLTYIGMLGHSYDLITVMKAIKRLDNENLKLMILGSGPKQKEFEEFAIKNDVNCSFTGYLEYGLMAAYLRNSDITINALKKKSAGSVINKIGDYLTAGKPLINGTSNNELNKLLECNNAGLNYEPESVEDLVRKLEVLVNNKMLREEMGNNARQLAENKFDRKNEYQKIIDLVNENLKE